MVGPVTRPVLTGGQARSPPRCRTQAARSMRCDAMILDDLGYVQQTRKEMEVLFTLLAEHYERRSVLITSNLVFDT